MPGLLPSMWITFSPKRIANVINPKTKIPRIPKHINPYSGQRGLSVY